MKNNVKINLKKQLKVWVCVFFALTLFLKTFPFEVHAAVERDSSGLGFGQTSVLYDSSIGMPTSEANAITQTSNGFIWIGSYSGLVRYDGNEFYRFDSSTGISSVVSLYVDSQDTLWVGTNDSGIACFHNGEFTFYTKDDGLHSSSIRSICEDPDGNIFIATTQGINYIDSESNLHSLDDERVNGVYIYDLKRDAQGRIYGETIGGNVFLIQDGAIQYFYEAAQIGIESVNCIYPDPEHLGYVYLGTEGSEIWYGNMLNGLKDMSMFHTPEQNNINALLKQGSQLWICSDDGIGYLDSEMNYTKLKNIALTSSVDDMMADQEGNLWFTSSRQGIMKITTGIFSDISRVTGLSSMVINTTCKYQGYLYAGTDSGLLVLDSSYAAVETELTKLLSGIRIRSIKTDSKGNLWICSYSEYGLICLNQDGNYSCYNTDDGFFTTKIRTVTELSNGDIAASVSGGVFFIAPGENGTKGTVKKSLSNADGLKNTEILTICENAAEKKIYMGSDGDGIYVVDQSETLSHIGPEDGLTSEVILRIKYDPIRDLYWVITSNSISYMKNDKVTAVTNFPYTNNFDIFFSGNDNVWILSSNGIYVTKAQDMIANKENISCEHYDSGNGLPYVTTANSRNFLSEDGDLYISGTAGITLVNIEGNESRNSEPKLCIPFIAADDRIIYLDDTNEVRIPANCKRLTIYGYVLTYTLTNPKVSYYLEGFDEESIVATKNTLKPVSYTNLDGGTYVFHLLAATDQNSSSDSLEIRIIKEKALYETWTFRILFAVLILALISGIIYMYFDKKTKSLEKKQRETRTLINQITKAFAKCIDMKDRYTNGHSFRVANYTKMLAERLGYGENEVEEIYNTALLHDIGKLSIPDAILNKPEGLNDEEYQIMKSHSANGYEILKEITIDPDLAIGAGYHHERLDGKGYPRGLKGDEIPMVAQIIAVADTFDAMYSTRPYRKKLSLDYVIGELKRVAGTQLNADVVELLASLAEEGLIQ